MKLYIYLETCLSSRFMSIVLWPGMIHLVPMLSQLAQLAQLRAVSALLGFVYILTLLGTGFVILCENQFSSVAQSCLILCYPMDCSMPGFPVHHQLPELAQTHVHRVGDAIQPSHPLSSPSHTLNLSHWKVVAEPWKTPGFMVSGEEEFNPGSVTRLDCSELLCI